MAAYLTSHEIMLFEKRGNMSGLERGGGEPFPIRGKRII